MKVFYDTNIILEYLFNRKEGETVRNILLWSRDNNVEKFLSSGSFYTITYLIEKHLKNQGLQDIKNRRPVLSGILSGLLQEYTIIGETDWEKAIYDVRFSDLEDSYQYQTALNADCNVLLTLMTDIYNPFSMLNAMKSRRLNDYWFKSGTPTYLLRLLAHSDENMNEITGRYYAPKEFIDYKATVEQPLPMIYQSGYLTIKKYDMEENSFLLDYPNNEVKEGFLSLVAAGYLVGDGNDSGI